MNRSDLHITGPNDTVGMIKTREQCLDALVRVDLAITKIEQDLADPAKSEDPEWKHKAERAHRFKLVARTELYRLRKELGREHFNDYANRVIDVLRTDYPHILNQISEQIGA